MPNMLLEEKQTERKWSLENHGAILSINPPDWIFDGPVAIDVETDEKDNFVGAALCGGNDVGYFTDIELLKRVLIDPDRDSIKLIGHNLKGDIKWLKKWGISLNESNLFYDTMIASYVTNPVRDSHGLKPLAQSVLSLVWPTYAQIVGKGRNKKTLEKQPVDLVAQYCGMDCFATWKLYQHFQATMTAQQRRIMHQVEMPLNRLLYKIEERGVDIDVKLLDELDVEFKGKIKEILDLVHNLTSADIAAILRDNAVTKLKEKWEQSAYKAFEKSKAFNPGSWQQKRLLLKFLGIEVSSTDKKELIKHRGNKLIDLLLSYSEFAKLYNAFIKAFKEMGTTLPTIHTTYNQVSEAATDEDDMHGIRTGRLSSKAPNLQQIPSRTENGKKLRRLFVPRNGQVFVVADYSQIELRLAAHFSGDPILVEAFNTGQDVHDATAKALNVDRFYGKTANFLLAFRGSHWRLMSVINAELQKKGQPLIDEATAANFYSLYWRNFKVLGTWEETMIKQARLRGGVNTIVGRWIPVSFIRRDAANVEARKTIWKVNHARELHDRRRIGVDQLTENLMLRAERQAISCIIQGSAADIIKLAMLACDKRGYTPVLTVHDELVFEIDKDIDGGLYDAKYVKNLMEAIVPLKIPLIAEVGTGFNWGEAKK